MGQASSLPAGGGNYFLKKLQLSGSAFVYAATHKVRICFRAAVAHIKKETTTHQTMKHIITILSALALAAAINAAPGDAKGDGKGKGKGKGKGDPAAAFARLDKNSDGKVSKDEFLASPAATKDAAKAEETFKKRDKNGDGFLSKEEFAPAKKPK